MTSTVDKQETTDLAADMTRLLPPGVLDDSTYSDIETALDRVGAPCTGEGGRFLKLAERVLALGVELGKAPE